MGQGCPLQSRDCLPGHAFPLCSAGTVIFATRVCVPFPHVLVHADHSCQLYAQSTGHGSSLHVCSTAGTVSYSRQKTKMVNNQSKSAKQEPKLGSPEAIMKAAREALGRASRIRPIENKSEDEQPPAKKRRMVKPQLKRMTSEEAEEQLAQLGTFVDPGHAGSTSDPAEEKKNDDGDAMISMSQEDTVPMSQD